MKKIFSFLLFISLVFSFSGHAYAQTVSLQLISESSGGTIGDDASLEPKFSDDGNFIVFVSAATNLVSGDTNGRSDVFVYSISTGEIELVSKSDGGTLTNADTDNSDISEDGRYVAFDSSGTNLVAGDTNVVKDVFVYDRNTDTIERVSVDSSETEASGGNSSDPAISDDGRYVAFVSAATNLVSGDTNGAIDVFVRDRTLGTTERVSVSSDETQSNGASFGTVAISEDGRYVAFVSAATNLVSGDTNGATDVFVRDRTSGTTERVSVSSDETQSNGASNASGIDISDDGRYVVFVSAATNLVSGDTNGATDVFVRDRTLGTTERVSVATGGTQSNGTSLIAQITFDGRFVTFASNATNLVSGDTNGVYDAFVHDRTTSSTRRINEDSDGNQDNADAAWSSISSTGQYATFYSEGDVFDGADGSGHVFYSEITDEDGVSASVEKAAPNSGDVNENSYLDSLEDNISSFVNAVSGNYATIETTGDCVRNDSPSASAESSLGTQDSDYDYPLGIIDFSTTCSDTGESATVTVYCFCENTPVAGLVARKYNSSTGEYATIDDAVISEVTIDGNRALKMVYTVTDGGELDEDGLENGTIVDPVGFAQPVAVASSSSSSGGSVKYGCKDENAVNYDRFSRHDPELCRYETDNFVVTGDYAKPLEEVSCTPFTTLMKLGSKQGEVSKLQQTLNSLGFNTGPVDGWFGNLTNAGVKAFQSSQNIDADGIVGPVTRGKLNGFCK